ncbi:hypothetical protein E0Z10_g5844 [Xylaria hypoxylon]|uniref:Uncharacterized protein n=1 Tax=Xylaria hypoxylon TaxID=37992 RepID=A0A4Z0YFP8_9PEZI|nr:hypothetical protein E0Z10_g5844 [Xylaria hypoxylon]
MDDPWSWDVERVVQELCTPGKSWPQSSTPLKLPPLDKLEEALREHEVDGEVLLTYDQAELCAELGIKILKHKSTFKNAVQDIRLRSNRYRVYRKRQASEFEDDDEQMLNNVHRPDEVEYKSASEHIQVPTPRISTSEPALLPSGSPLSVADEQVTKKRKIVPTLITTTIDPNRNRNIATEADTVYFASEPAVEHTGRESVNIFSHNLSTGAYLGSKSITRFDIVDSDYISHLEPPLGQDKQFNFVSTSRLIPGRMVQTHRLMKRQLLRGNTRRRTRLGKPDIVSGSNNPDHDKVLPLYGDSDDDMEYDSDTWREIEAEKNEKDSEQSLPKGLTAEEINSTFDRVLQQIASEWRTTKLPKYASKANGVWNEARRSGLKDAIDRARRDLRAFESRIAKWKETIQKHEYRNVVELEQLLSAFEPSVFDREHRLWLISVLTSPSEPVKISRPRGPRKHHLKPQPALADDEEILASESEDDLKDFIVDDELDVHISADDGPLSDTGEEDHTEHSGHPGIGMALGKSVDIAEELQVILDSRKFPKKTLQTPSKPSQPIIIDLTTPPDRMHHLIHYKDGKLSVTKNPIDAKKNVISSPLIMGITDLTVAEQKVASELETVDQPFIDAIFSITRFYAPEDIWLDLILPAFDREWPTAPYNTYIKKDSLTAYTLVRLFDTYQDNTLHKLKRYKKADDKEKQRLQELYKLYPEEWDAFVRFLKRLSDRFEWTETAMSKKKHGVSTTSAPNGDGEKEPDINSLSDDTDVSTDKAAEKMIDSSEKKKKKKKKKKRKEVVRNREAAMVRDLDQALTAEQENRRKLLRARLEQEGSTALGSQHGSIIVNESKGDDQGFIYINDEIAPRIKDHQTAGVRFMWDQLVVAKKRQGCLLAHTMGLGKTMQVITLLVTISQASASDDPTVSSQIPEELRESRTLILCPATLVNNWLDEMLSWLPENHELGAIFKVDATLGAEKRNQVIRNWDALGGIMIIGYNLFKAFVADEDMSEIFLERPNIVVADEAHMMKNPKAKTHVAAANFRTLSRVALTGSPLANNVEEYFAMINWVAPNYLGDILEFRARYANPINHGLHADSTASDRRRALRMLRVLKSEVSPKVSRITIAVLKNNIPRKTEFVITVPLTPIQRQAYEMFIQYHHSNGDSDSKKIPVFAIHDLSLICASPSIFLEKLKEMKSVGNSSTNKTESVTLPQQLISDEMALLRNAERGAKDDFALSWKVPILLEILAQCKKLGDYVLLFSHSKVALNYLEGVLRMKKHSFMRLDGDTQMAGRQDMVKSFNKGNIDIFLISTKAGALGLNITGANRVIIFDAQFNPQNEQQAVGRAYRIGQKKPVFVYRFVCGGTCEQKILHQAIWKMQLASRVVDKKHLVNKAPRFAKAWDMPEEPKQEELDPFLGKDTVLDALLKEKTYREGIRAVQMMDVFEEEAVEDAELSAEDVAISDQMILANEARRQGQPLPTPLPATLIAGNGIISLDGHGLISPGQPSFTGTPSESRPAQQPPFDKHPSAGQPLPQSSLARFAVPSSEHTSHDPRPPSTLPPMQLPGAEVHIRPSNDYSNGSSADVNKSWNSLLEIQGDLSRAFAVHAGFPDRGTRSQVGSDVSSAIWENWQYKTPEQQSAMNWAIMRAASVERFVEALCMGLISPQQLAQLSPENIDQHVKMWREEDASEWETKKRTWSSRRQSRDPEHLQTALQRWSTVPNQGEDSRQTDQSKSYRVDDHEALQAVFERRRLKTQQKDDQEALQAVMERRKVKDSLSQSSDTSKEPRLPNWAKNVVRQAQIPAPSSSVPPRTPSSPKFSPRPQSRTPFK